MEKSIGKIMEGMCKTRMQLSTKVGKPACSLLRPFHIQSLPR